MTTVLGLIICGLSLALLWALSMLGLCRQERDDFRAQRDAALEREAALKHTLGIGRGRHP